MRRTGAIVLALLMMTTVLPALGTMADEVTVSMEWNAPASRDFEDLIEVSNGLPSTGYYTTTYFVNLNGDAFLDIVAGRLAISGGSPGLTAYVSVNGNSWQGAFTGLPNTGSFALGAVADVDNDLDIDLIVPYENENSVGSNDGIEIWLSNGGAGGTVQWTHGLDPINTSTFDGVAADDVDGDGYVDIAASDQTGGIRFWKGNGGTGWTDSSTGLPSTGNNFHGLVFADMNEDSLKDIVIGSDIGLHVFTNDGDGSWTDNSSGFPALPTVWNVRVADLDHDDNLDIVAATNTSVKVYTGNGGTGGTFTWTQETTGLPTTNYYESLGVGDVDQDGNLDILFGSIGVGVGVGLYLGDGGSGGALDWTQVGSSRLPTTEDFYAADLGDFNGDNTADVLLGSGANAGLRVWRTRAPISELPVADAGPDRQVYINDPVTLDGSASYDDTGIEEYDWDLVSQPQGSSITLDDETIVNPTFTPTVVGPYKFNLTVKDIDQQWGPPDSVTITAKVFPNALPTANAGGDQFVLIFSTVHLDGSNSTDDAGEGGIQTYDWNVTQEPEDSHIELSDDKAIDPTFVPQYIGDYRITLTVQDINDTWAVEDQVVITVKPVGEYPPYANAGPSQTVELGDPLHLNGSGSYDDTYLVEYKWTVFSEPAGSNLVIPPEAEPTVQPTKLGIYNIQLEVRDSDNLWSEPDTVVITVVPQNLDPEVVMAAPLDGDEFLTIQEVTFDATGSNDPEGGPLTYRWESSLEGLLSIEKTSKHSLEAGTHVITLTVKDDHDNTASVSVTITVREDKFPTAVLAANTTLVHMDDPVSFDGTGSSDPEGVVTEYFFNFGDGTDSDWVRTPKVTHVYDSFGIYGATLKVKDSIGQISNTTQALVIKVGVRPDAKVEASATTVKQKKSITLDATASSDRDGEVVSYFFDFGDKTNSGWIDDKKITHSYEKSGRFTVKVRVKDEDGFASEPAMVTIAVKKASSSGPGMDMTIPIILIVVIVVITIVVVIVAKRKTEANVEAQKKAQMQAPKEDFSDVDALLVQQQGQQPPPQYPPDQQQQQYDYDQGQYEQQPSDDQGYGQGQEGYEQQQQEGYDQSQYPPPQPPPQ